LVGNIILSNMSEYYTYIYLNPLKPGIYLYDNYVFNFQPFYVGGGHGDRDTSHLRESKFISEVLKEDRRQYCKTHSINLHKVNTILKIWQLGKEPIIQRVGENISRRDSFNLEKSLIKLIGRADLRKGPLTNWTDGGEGIQRLSKSKRKRISLGKLRENNLNWKGGVSLDFRTKEEKERDRLLSREVMSKKKQGKNNPNFGKIYRRRERKVS